MSSNPYWQLLTQSTLVTLPEWGIAYYHPHIPATHTYGRGYFQEYQRRAQTEIGVNLNVARMNLVRKYGVLGEDLIDIGVGAGNFVAEYPCWGYDINPYAIDTLHAMNRFMNPMMAQGQVNLTFWDSLEHIPDPKPLLDRVTNYCFVSTPIYEDLNLKLLRSKHYKPNEHCWYFTQHGVTRFMKAHGFELLEVTDIETKLGREAIKSFVFARPHGISSRAPS